MGVFARADDGLGDLAERGEVGLDLAELDAVAADLDLEIGATEEDEATVGEAAAAVAGAVEARAVAVGEERGSGEIRAAPVAERDVAAADGELALAVVGGTTALIEEQDLGRGDGAADRYGILVERIRSRKEGLEREGRLGGAEAVDEHGVGSEGAAEGGEVRGADDLAAEDDAAHVGESAAPRLGDEVTKHRRRRVEHGDPALAQPGGEAREAAAAQVPEVG